MATDVNVVPTGNYSISGNITGTYAAVDDTPGSPNDSDYLYNGQDGSADALLSFPAQSIPAGSTINSVKLIYRSKTGASSTLTGVRGLLRIGGTVYTSGSETYGTSYTTITDTLTTNPKSGVAWTVDDVNGSGGNALQAFGVRLKSAVSDPVYYYSWCSQVYLTINYTAASGVAYSVIGSGMVSVAGSFSSVG